MLSNAPLAVSRSPSAAEATPAEPDAASPAGLAGGGVTSAEVLLTAAEAYPALERAFLAARSEIVAGFRVFDLETRLRTPEARAHGETWVDLIAAVLKRGVAMQFIIADFDPVAMARLHRRAWATLRQFAAAREIAGLDARAGQRLRVDVALHPARLGLLPRLALYAAAQGKIATSCAALNALAAPARIRALDNMPYFCPLVSGAPDRLAPRRGVLPFLYPATHHQKLAVFDRQRLYIGGLDLNERRFDSPEHHRPAEETWHDLQVMVEGPVVAEAAHHLETLLDVVAGRVAPPRHRHLLTTVSVARRFALPYMSPLPRVRSIDRAHRDLIRAARRLIYLETQFFRDRGLARALARAARRNPDLGLILIVPGAPETVAFHHNDGIDARFGEFLQVRSLEILRQGFGQRMFVGSPVQPRRAESGARDTLHGAPLVYVHAKLSVFDETAAIVSSANLNGRSLAWDTEAGVLLDRAEDVATLRRRAFDHMLGEGAETALHDPARAVAAWTALARANAARAPEARQGLVVPYDPAPAEDFGSDVPGVSEEMV